MNNNANAKRATIVVLFNDCTRVVADIEYPDVGDLQGGDAHEAHVEQEQRNLKTRGGVPLGYYTSVPRGTPPELVGWALEQSIKALQDKRRK